MPPKKTVAKKAVAKKIRCSDGPTTTAGGAGVCNGSAASCATCGICEQPIIDGKDQALFCEGTCKQWIHRFCAGVPLSWFVILGSSSTPFRCYSCCHAKYADDVDSLTTQIKTLKSELGELKEVVGNLSALSTASQVSAVTGGVSELHCFTSQSDVGVGGRGGGMGRRGRGGSRGRGGRGSNQGASRRRFGHPTSSGRKPPEPGRIKEKVEGARRVWGTFSVCTTGTIHSAITKVCAVDSVRVKKKTKEMSNGKVCWWFVLHDDEANLQVIDAKWEQVELQTSWKLEPCFRLAQSPIMQDPSNECTAVDELSVTPHTHETPSTPVPLLCPLPQPPPPAHEGPSEDLDIRSVTDQSNVSFLVNSLQPQQKQQKQQLENP